MKLKIVKIANSVPSEGDWEASECYLLRENVRAGEPTHRTELRALYHGESLFLRYDVWDDFILANRKQNNENLFEEEVVELFYSPDGDLTRYFEMEFNVNRAIFFGSIHNPNGGKRGMEVRMLDCDGIECSVKNFEGGYTVTVSVPFERIGGSPQKGAKGNAFRIDWFPGKRRELQALQPTLSRSSFHIPSNFVEIEWVAE